MTPQTRLVRLALAVALCFAAPVLRAETAPISSAETKLLEALSMAIKANDYQQALQQILQLLKLHPEDDKLIKFKAFLLRQLEFQNGIISIYKQDTEIFPDDEKSWGVLCSNLISFNRIKEARSACKRSVEIKKNIENTTNLGHTFLLEGNTENAYSWYRESLKLIRSHEDLINGPLESLDTFIEKEIKTKESRAAKSWFETSFSQIPALIDTTSKIEELKNSGKYAAAIPLAHESLAKIEQIAGRNDPVTGFYLGNLAELYELNGEYGKALPLAQRALAIAEESQNSEPSKIGIRLNTLAGIYNATGDYINALNLYQRSLTITEQTRGSDHIETSAILNNMALLYSNMGNYTQALPLYLRSLSITEKSNGHEHPDTGMSLNNLARLYLQMGNPGKAMPLVLRALAITEKSLGPEHPDTSSCLQSLAVLYTTMGDDNKALPLYQRALTIAENSLGNEHPATASSTQTLALQHRLMANPTQALPLYERYITIVEKLRSQSGLGVEAKQNLFAQYVGGYKDYAQLLGEQKQPEKAFHLFELSKARTLLEETAARAGQQVLPAEEAAALENLRRQLALLNDKVAKAENDTQRANLSASRDQVERELSTLHGKLLTQYPKYAQLTTPTILPSAEAARHLPEDAVYVSYLENEGQILALTMSSDGVVSYHDLGKPAALAGAVAAYRAMVARPNGLAGLADEGV
ncbi:Tetratricopeptide repeat-containing protein, partial [Formivibrio citricus]